MNITSQDLLTTGRDGGGRGQNLQLKKPDLENRETRPNQQWDEEAGAFSNAERLTRIPSITYGGRWARQKNGASSALSGRSNTKNPPDEVGNI